MTTGTLRGGDIRGLRNGLPEDKAVRHQLSAAVVQIRADLLPDLHEAVAQGPNLNHVALDAA